MIGFDFWERLFVYVVFGVGVAVVTVGMVGYGILVGLSGKPFGGIGLAGFVTTWAALLIARSLRRPA